MGYPIWTTLQKMLLSEVWITQTNAMSGKIAQESRN